MRRLRTCIALAVAAGIFLAAPTAAYADDLCTTVGTVSPALGSLLDATESGSGLTEGVCTDQVTTSPDPEPKPEQPTVEPAPEPSSSTASRPVTDSPVRTPVVTDADVTDPLEPAAPAGEEETSGGGTINRVVRIAARIPVVQLSIAGFLAVVLSLALGAVLGRRGVERRVQRVADAQVDAVLALVPEGVIVADEAGAVRQINAQAAELVGVERGDARGSTVASLLRGTDARGGWLPGWVRENGTRSGSTTATLDGPDRIPVAIAASTYPGGNVFVLRDLRTERSLERMKAEFLANVGHELRTPLTSALGFAQILRKRELSPSQRETFADAVVDACRKLSRVVDLLIDVATIEGGGFSSDADAVDLGELARQTAHEWKDLSPEHVFAEQIPQRRPRVRANAALLRHALDELIDNAVKFSPGGGLVTVGVATRTEARRSVIELSVSDQGVGIDPASVAEIFEDFKQADGSSTRSFGGLGLGLGFVRRVAALHDGTVKVVSEPGAGTTITITMPVRRAAEDTQQKAAPGRVRVRSAARPARARA